MSLDPDVPIEFQPTCVDCGYDLNGIPDGRCPECGVRFSRKGLLRRFQEERRAAKERSEARFKRFRTFAGLIAIYGTVGFFTCASSVIPFENVWVFSILLAAIAVAAVAYCAWMDRAWMVRSHRLLIFLVPLIVMSFAYSAVPYRSVALPVIGLCAVIVAVLALRDSPLISAFLLFLIVALPLLAASLLLAAHAGRREMLGLTWTDWNVPTIHGWAPLKTAEALPVAVRLFFVGCVLTLLAGFYTRRAIVRLRRARREFPTLSEWLQQSL